jgi:hypothetical protein
MSIAKEWGTEKIPESYILDNHFQLKLKIIDEQKWDSLELIQMMRGWIENTQH